MKKLPKSITDLYWKQVQNILQEEQQLTEAIARLGIQAYRAALDKADVGDVVYHAPIEETVAGIVQGGYLFQAQE